MEAMRSALSGHLRKDGRWQITVTLTQPDGTKKGKTIYRKTQREVQDAARQLLVGGRGIHAKRTVAELLEHCKADPWSKLAPKTQEQYTWATTHILPLLGKEDVRKLDPPKVSKWLKSLACNP